MAPHLIPLINHNTLQFVVLVHLLSGLIFLSLPHHSPDLVAHAPAELATLLMRSHSLKPLSLPLQRFLSAWKTLARLFKTVTSTETHLNHHFLQEAFSDASNLYHIFPHQSSDSMLCILSSSYSKHQARQIIPGIWHLFSNCLLNPQNANTMPSPSPGKEKQCKSWL